MAAPEIDGIWRCTLTLGATLVLTTPALAADPATAAPSALPPAALFFSPARLILASRRFSF